MLQKKNYLALDEAYQPILSFRPLLLLERKEKKEKERKKEIRKQDINKI